MCRGNRKNFGEIEYILSKCKEKKVCLFSHKKLYIYIFFIKFEEKKYEGREEKRRVCGWERENGLKKLFGNDYFQISFLGEFSVCADPLMCV